MVTPESPSLKEEASCGVLQVVVIIIIFIIIIIIN